MSYYGSKSDYIYSAYIIPFEEIKKVVPNEVIAFEEKSEEALVFLRLSYTQYGFNIDDIFEYCVRDDIEGCRIYSVLNGEDFNVVCDFLEVIYSLLVSGEDSVLGAFKRETNIGLGVDYNYDTEKPYFYLIQDDLIQLTPSGHMLKNKGVMFDFKKWVESY